MLVFRERNSAVGAGPLRGVAASSAAGAAGDSTFFSGKKSRGRGGGGSRSVWFARFSRG